MSISRVEHGFDNGEMGAEESRWKGLGEKICPPLRGQSACELARTVSKLLLVAAAADR